MRDRITEGESSPSRARIGALAVVVLAGVVAASQLAERLINRIWRPDLVEWEWISEILVIGALAVVTALWSRLRFARTAIARLERERLTMQAELGVAARVQRGLLPAIPATLHGIEWHAVMDPAGQVGGDYYDFFPVGEDRLCVVLADVSGKGVPAAVFVSNTRAVLRSVARSGAEPHRILREVSDTLLLDGGGELYVTCIVAVVDARSRMMTYANAGHPAGVRIRQDGRTQPLTVGGPPLGLLPSSSYEEETLSLESGDLVVLVSDGISEALDAGGDRIAAALSTGLVRAQVSSAVEACRVLLEQARESSGPAGVDHWADDRTVVAFAVARDINEV